MTGAEAIIIPEGKSVYFASDFHLGTPNKESSSKREKLICQWLNEVVANDGSTLFLVGDIFDFWFEYKYVIPKGFIRFQGELARLVDAGIDVRLFTGNHDMWMFDYFTSELGLPIYRQPTDFYIGGKKFHIGHGDGLGPGDQSHKLLKKVFENKFCQWAFGMLPPRWGMGIATNWSQHSRAANMKREQEILHKESEWLFQYCLQEEQQNRNRDYYIMGHRHLPMLVPVNQQAMYCNLGEWLYHNSFAKFNNQQGLSLNYYGKSTD